MAWAFVVTIFFHWCAKTRQNRVSDNQKVPTSLFLYTTHFGDHASQRLSMAIIKIGELIKEQLHQQGKTVVWFAPQLSCSRNNIYKIFRSNSIASQEFEGILLSNVPREAQIGVIAHELAHTVQYESYNFIGIIQLGLMYLDEESKSIFERETDERTISRGFGKNLKAWAQYSMYDSPKATQEYKDFKKRVYMSPQEIETEMERYSCYSATDGL